MEGVLQKRDNKKDNFSVYKQVPFQYESHLTTPHQQQLSKILNHSYNENYIARSQNSHRIQLKSDHQSKPTNPHTLLSNIFQHTQLLLTNFLKKRNQNRTLLFIRPQ